MLGGLSDFKPHHRLQASDRLIKLDSSPEFTGMVREHTRGGDLISQFLISAVTGRLPDFQPCHRMEATRQLAIINPKMAQALSEDNTPRRSRGVHTDAVGAPSPSMGEGWGEGEAGAAQQLADIIRQETNDGRDIARFFIDVMEGTRTGFKTSASGSRPHWCSSTGATTLSQPSARHRSPRAPARPVPRYTARARPGA